MELLYPAGLRIGFSCVSTSPEGRQREGVLMTTTFSKGAIEQIVRTAKPFRERLQEDLAKVYDDPGAFDRIMGGNSQNTTSAVQAKVASPGVKEKGRS